MSSFSCPHIDPVKNYCERLKKDCVPGRNGCVLAKKYVFAVPAEERIKEREKEKKDNSNFEAVQKVKYNSSNQ